VDANSTLAIRRKDLFANSFVFHSIMNKKKLQEVLRSPKEFNVTITKNHGSVDIVLVIERDYINTAILKRMLLCVDLKKRNDVIKMSKRNAASILALVLIRIFLSLREL